MRTCKIGVTPPMPRVRTGEALVVMLRGLVAGAETESDVRPPTMHGEFPTGPRRGESNHPGHESPGHVARQPAVMT